MADVNINYKGNSISQMNSTGTKTLTTMGQFCEDNITISYTKINDNPEASNNDVIFIDYDGFVRYSYSVEDFNNLTEMPPNPIHAGLIGQGWNWTLSEAKTYLTQYDKLIIGQNYVTDDGATRIYVQIDEDTKVKEFTLRFGQSADNAVEVDWGDGSTPQTFTGVSNSNHIHLYNQGGIYCISLSCTEGKLNFTGTGTSSTDGYSCFGTRAHGVNSLNKGRIIKIELGNNIETIGQSAFYGCYAMRSITIPTNITSIDSFAFNLCYGLHTVILPPGVTTINEYCFQYAMSLTTVSLPNTITSIGTYAFASCYGMKGYSIPYGCTTIGAYAFQNCPPLKFINLPNITILNNYTLYQLFSLATLKFPNRLATIGQYAVSNAYGLCKITIPSSVTAIQANAFNGAYSLKEIHLLRTTPPSLASTNAFSNIHSACVFYVPQSENHTVLNAYKSATNWSSFSSKMMEEP